MKEPSPSGTKSKKKRANRRGGSGRGFSTAVAKHAKETLAADLRRSSERSAELHVPLEATAMEVLPGIPERAFVPSLNRMATGPEVTKVLETAARERSEIDVPRNDRQGKTRPYKPAGGVEFSHGQLRLDLFLALFWGRKAGLPAPNDLLDKILRKVERFLKETYGDGIEVVAACLHTPDPHVEEALRAKGWRGAIPDPSEDDKIGAWNLHVQIYVCRVRDRKLQTERQMFSHASDSVVSSWQLRELGIDLDLHRASRLRGRREAQYALALRTGGKKGRILPPGILKKLEKGRMSQDEAIATAIETELERKERSWAKAKKAHSLTELNKIQVADARRAQAIDLLLAEWFSKEVEEGLPSVHREYANLIVKARKVFPELKRRQMESGHRLLLNEVLTLWEREEREAEEEKRREDFELYDAAFTSGLSVATFQSDRMAADAYGELADIADREKKEAVEAERAVWSAQIEKLKSAPPKIVLKTVADPRLISENAILKKAVAELETKKEVAASDAKAQVALLLEMVRFVNCVKAYNAGDREPEMDLCWDDRDWLRVKNGIWTVGPGFETSLQNLTNFPEQAAELKKSAQSCDFMPTPAWQKTSQAIDIASRTE